MKAMILAAGFGTRLGTLSEHTPKCLVQAGGKTMLEHVIEHLQRAGVTTVIINLHHLSNTVVAYVKEKDDFGINIVLSHEDVVRGTGGGIKFARKHLDDVDFFIVHNADIYSEMNLSGLIEAHKIAGSLATLAVRQCETESFLVVDEADHLCGWINEKSNTRNLRESVGPTRHVTFTGVHVASREVFRYFEDESNVFSVFTPYMKAVHGGEQISVYDIGERYWIDIGTPEKLAALNERLSS